MPGPKWPDAGVKPVTVKQWVQQVRWGCRAGWHIIRGGSVIENVVVTNAGINLAELPPEGLWINRVRQATVPSYWPTYFSAPGAKSNVGYQFYGSPTSFVWGRNAPMGVRKP